MPFKKSITIFVLFLLMGIPGAFCQGINFSELSFQEIQQQAIKQDKPVFVYFYDKDCEGCAFNSGKLFQDSVLSHMINQHFLSIKVNRDSPDGEKIKQKYSVNSFGLLYFGIHSTLLTSVNYITARAEPNLIAARFAVKHRDDSLIWSLNESFRRGDRSLSFLKKLLYISSQYPGDNREILEAYVNQLPSDSLSSVNVLRFILEQAPLINSHAFKAVFSNPALRQEVYAAHNYKENVEINNRIIDKSFSLAVQAKDSSYVKSVAWFTRSTWGEDTIRGQKEYEHKMVSYYEQVRDTARYFPLVTAYLNKYYMPVNADSLYKVSKERMDKERRFIAGGDTVRFPNGILLTHQAYIVPDSFYYFSNTLNNAAFKVYELKGSTFYIQQALAWVSKALDYSKLPNYYDTYARLLYIEDRIKEAISWEKKAVDMVNKSPQEVFNPFESVLDKMEKKEL